MEKNTQVHQTPRSHIANAAGNSHVEDLSDIQVEAYELGGKVTGLVLWKGKSNDPFLSLKVSESGQMTPFVLESDTDMPEHDDSRTLLFSRVVTQTAGEGQGGAIEGLAVYSGGKAEPAIALGSIDGLFEAQAPQELLHERQRG